MKVKFPIYAHTEHEEADWLAQDDIERGLTVPLDLLTEFYGSRPLYEVEFDVEYDTDTQTFAIVAARPTNGGMHGNWELTQQIT